MKVVNIFDVLTACNAARQPNGKWECTARSANHQATGKGPTYEVAVKNACEILTYTIERSKEDA